MGLGSVAECFARPCPQVHPRGKQRKGQGIVRGLPPPPAAPRRRTPRVSNAAGKRRGWRFFPITGNPERRSWSGGWRAPGD
eukprot:5670430-Pyramimonas_sp.AAC.1